MAGGKMFLASKAPRRRAKTSEGKKPLNKTEKSQVKTIARRVLRNQLEWKQYDTFNNFTAGWSGYVFTLANLTQGDGDDAERVGDEIYATSVDLRWYISNGDNNNVCRIIMFQYTADDTVNPGVGTVLTNVGTAYSVISPYNADHVGKDKSVRILSDQMFTLNANFDGASQYRVGHTKVPLKIRKVQYLGGTVNGINKPWILVISDSSIVSHPDFKMYARLNYQDG